MPDDLSGAQVHLVYAIPADGVDRALDTNGTIAGTVSVWESWLAGQTGGSVLRLDTYHGVDDITFVRLPQSDAEMASHGVYVRDVIEADLRAAGLIVAGKIYAVYYDGSSMSSCGGGSWPPELVGSVGALYLHGAPPGAPACDTNVFASQGEKPGYLDFAMLHELLHVLGFVPSCAPHAVLRGHVSDSNTDLMYAGPLPWNPTTLDVGRDDYYGAHIPGCLDLADSPYLQRLHSITVTVSGLGTVTSTPDGIACPTTCTTTYQDPMTLTATPSSGSAFTGWTGACSGNATCVITGSTDLAVGARFTVTVAPKKPKAKRAPLCRKKQHSTKAHPCRRK